MNNNQSDDFNKANVCGAMPAAGNGSPAYAPRVPTLPNNFTPPLRKIVKIDIFDIVAFILTFGLSYFFFYEASTLFTVSSIGFCVSYILIFALATAYIVSKQKTFPRSAVFPGAIALLSAFSQAYNGYESFMFNPALVMMIIASGLYCIELTGSNKHSNGSYFYLLDLLKCQVIIPIIDCLVPLRSLLENRRKKDENSKKIQKKTIAVIIGFVCAIPVLFIVVPLLLSDAAFDSLIGSLAHKIAAFFSKDIEIKFIDPFILFITLLFAPYIYMVMFVFRHGLTKRDNTDTAPKYAKLRVVSTSLICGFLGVICAVYVIYLLSQSAYFFSAFAGHLPGGMKITVTEYARQGFFEMTKIAGINLCIIAICVLFGKRKNGEISPVVKWFSLFLCLFNTILVATSISKILLYMNQMGLTEKRIYVFVFDIALIFVFLAIIARLFKKDFPYMRVIIATFCIVVTLLSWVNIGDVIVTVNTDMCLKGKLPVSAIENDDYDDYDIRHYAYTKAEFEAAQKLAASSNKELAEHGRVVLYTAFSDDYYSFEFDKNKKIIRDNLDQSISMNSYIKYLEENYNQLQEYINPSRELKKENFRHQKKYSETNLFIYNDSIDITFLDSAIVDSIVVTDRLTAKAVMSITDEKQIQKVLKAFVDEINNNGYLYDEYAEEVSDATRYSVQLAIDGSRYNAGSYGYDNYYISCDIFGRWEKLINE